MPRIIDRLTSQAPEDKDPGAIRVDVPGKRKLNEAIVDDRPDPVTGEGSEGFTADQFKQMDREAKARKPKPTRASARNRGRDMDKYLGDVK